MRQPAAFALALALGVIAAVALASCGGGEDAKLLPGTTAQEISENLDTVQQLAAEGECVGAADAAQNVSDEVEALGEVDAKLKQALQQGAERLSAVVTSCEDEEEAEDSEAVAPASEATSTEETAKQPPGLEKKEEKEREKEEKAAEKEAEKEASQGPPETPAETTPAEPPATTPPPSEGGGTGAPGGVSPGTPAEPGGE